MATKEDYARWITANQDKVGTPEFLTVAAAYRRAGIDERRAATAATPDPTANPNPTDGMSGAQKFLAGMGKGMTDIGRGAGQLLGMVDESDIDASKQRDAALMDTGAGFAGNLTGSVATMAPTAMIPGVNSYLGAGLLGTATGAMQPVGSEDSRLKNTMVGGAAGVAGQGLANALARVLNPQTSKAVTDLMDEGVTPTPGQILGGGWKKAESSLESIPLVSQAIGGAKSRAVNEFNEAALNRAVAPIGKTVSAIGHEGMRQAREAVEQSYDDALALLPPVQIDPPFQAAIAQAKSNASALIPDRARQFEKIIDDEVVGRIGNSPVISGEMLKTIESQVKKKASQLLKTPGYDEQQMGQALNDLAGEIRGLAGRASPEAAEALKSADTAYAMLVRLENAGGSQAAPQGVFTPRQLGAAIRNMDGSLRKKSIAQGSGLMQDLATSGREVLEGGVANSGTPERAMMAALISGRGSAGEMAGMVGTAGLYTDPAQKLIAALLARRPDIMRQAGTIVSRGAPISALTAAEAAQ
jgi:hypothetical protein